MKWSIREAVDVYFKAKSTFKLGARTIRAGEPVLIFDTVKTSTLEVASETSYLTGGRGNTRILSFEGDKTLTFSFEDALLSAEGVAILAGADIIPARNKHLAGSSPEARSVISHFTEKFSVPVSNMADAYEGTGATPRNVYPDDQSLSGDNKKPRGGDNNVWLTRKPYVGQNSSIYVILLDDAGEMSGAPIEVNMRTEPDATRIGPANNVIYLNKFKSGNEFIAFDKSGVPIKVTKNSEGKDTDELASGADAAKFDDKVEYYVDFASANANWSTAWGVAADYKRVISATAYGASWGANTGYSYLLAPSGGIAQPKCFKEGAQFVYKCNVPSILYQDIVLIDYYVEYRHDATQISILPDKFAPYMYVEGSSLLRRASDGMDLPVEFVIPKLKITTALTFTLQSTGDPSTFNFQGDSYPDFSKFDLTRKVLADIQILDADDNYDLTAGVSSGDPTSYRRYQYNEDMDGDYLWKDPAIEQHSNIDYSDTGYNPANGGPASVNMDSNGNGTIYHIPEASSPDLEPEPEPSAFSNSFEH